MKRIITVFVVLCIATSLCSCAGYNKELEIVRNQRGSEIMSSIDAMLPLEIFEDISAIDLKLKPDYSKEYTTEIVSDEENDACDINYYLDDKLIYTKYDGYGENGFAYYTKTLQGLDATVKYFETDGENASVRIETQWYYVSINRLNSFNKFGISDASIVAYSTDESGPFQKYLTYNYTDNKAYFSGANYMKNGDYIHYSCDYADGVCEEYERVIVNGKSIDSSDDIISIVTTDKSYNEADILVGANKWDYWNNCWYTTAKLALTFDDEASANAYVQRNNLSSASVNYYNVYVVEITDVTLRVDESIALEDNQLRSYIINDIDDSYFGSINFDSDGKIIALNHSSEIELY